MFHRTLLDTLQRAWAQFPVIVLTGARQAGKTTLARHFLPDAHYTTLDVFTEAERAKNAPNLFLAQHPAPLIIDEVQYAPSLFREIKIRVDADRRAGQFLLTGSQGFGLMSGVTESLAGRCAIFQLPALALSELPNSAAPATLDTFIWRGGFPELWKNPEMDSALWLGSYITTYVERDVRNLLNIGNLRDFERFLRALALRAAQVLSYTDLARDVGISPNTAKSWLSALEASQQIFLLEPWHRQRIKRLVKSPKIYFNDTGLLVYLMGFRNAGELRAHSLWGAIWENLVVAEVRKQFLINGQHPPLWYWRTTTGNEIDLLIETAPETFSAIECKSSEHVAMSDARQFGAFRTEYGDAALEKSYLVCRAASPYPLSPDNHVEAVPLAGIGGMLDVLQKKIASENRI
jgi:predicted AAA+ superfamily ATPase